MSLIDPSSILPTRRQRPLPLLEGRSPEAEAALAKAAYLIQTFRDANLRFGYGFTVDSAEEKWAVSIAPFPALLLEEVAEEFVGSADREAPTIGEFVAAVEQTVRDRRRRAQREAEGLEPEPEIDPETNRLIREWVLGRHTLSTHDQAACDHELCQKATREKGDE